MIPLILFLTLKERKSFGLGLEKVEMITDSAPEAMMSNYQKVSGRN